MPPEFPQSGGGEQVEGAGNTVIVTELREQTQPTTGEVNHCGHKKHGDLQGLKMEFIVRKLGRYIRDL